MRLIFLLLFTLFSSTFLFSQMNGTYTLGTNSSYDFQSFEQLIDSLTIKGINGDVIIKIATGSYSTQFTLPHINGLSQLNQLVFEPLNQTVYLTTTGSNIKNYIINCDSASYVTFNNLNFLNYDVTYGVNINIEGGCHHININNCSFATITQPNSTSTTFSLIYSGSGIDKFISIDSCHFENAAFGIYWLGDDAEDSNSVTNCNFKNQYVASIYGSFQKNLLIESNVFKSTSTHTQYRPIELDNVYEGCKINKNKTSTYSEGFSILIDGSKGTNTNPIVVSNNFFHAGGNTLAIGIFIESSQFIDILNNNINLSGSSSASTGRAINIQNQNSSATHINIYNNNIKNNSTGYGLITFSTDTIFCDYNNYYVPRGAFGYWNGFASNSLGSWISVTKQDSNSKKQDPGYYSDEDLHISNTFLDSIGLYFLTVPDDIDNETRQFGISDIGADEIWQHHLDLGIVSLESPIILCPQSSFQVSFKVKNFGTDTIYHSDIDWYLDGIKQTQINLIGQILPGSDTIIEAGIFLHSSSQPKVFAFKVVAVNGWNDQNNVNDSLHASVGTGVSGFYTIGKDLTYDFQSFNSAIAFVKENGLCGPVFFEVDSGIYTEQIIFPEIIGVSAVNTITFESKNQDPDHVVLTFDNSQWYANYTMFVTGKYYRFNYLTLQTDNVSYANIIKFSGEIEDVIFKGNKIYSPIKNSQSFDFALVYCPIDNYSSNNIIFDSNEFINGSYAFYLWGNSTAYDNKLVIVNNKFKNQFRYGVVLYYQNGVVFSNNVIETNSTIAAYTGISSYYSKDSILISNNIIDIKNGGIALSLYLCTFTASKPGLIANNFIHVAGNSPTAYGIFIESSPYLNVYHNSVNISNINSQGRAIFIQNGNNVLKVKNNVFANTGGGYSVFCYQTTSLSLNYNDLYTTGNNLAYWSGGRTNLASWQTASGQDYNSISVDPYFKTNKDLHSTSIELDSAGTSLNDIKFDIDGDLRNSLYPDIGADEFILKSFDASIVSIPVFEEIVCDGLLPIEVNLKNFGIVRLDSVDVYWSVNQQPFNQQKVYPNLGYLEDTTVTIGYYPFDADSMNQIVVNTYLPNNHTDENHINDTFKIDNIRLTYSPGLPIVDHDTICSNSTALLKASSSKAFSYNWYDSLYSGNLLSTDSFLVTPKLLSSQTYYVSAGSIFKPDSFLTSFSTNSTNLTNGNMFDIVANDHEIYIDSFDINTQYTSSYDIWVYYKHKSFRGFANDSTAWNQVLHTTIDANGNGKSTRLSLPKSILIHKYDTVAFYISTSQVSFVNFIGNKKVFSNNDMMIDTGIALDYLFDPTYAVTAAWSGRVYYSNGSICSTPRIPASATVKEMPVLLNVEDTSVCSNYEIELNVNVGPDFYYEWKKLPSSKVISTQPNIIVDTNGFYAITVSDDCGNSVSKTITVDYYPSPIAKFEIDDISHCFATNEFKFNNKSSVAVGIMDYFWEFDAHSTSIMKDPTHSFSDFDTFHVVLYVGTNTGCFDTASGLVSVYPDPIVRFAINDSIQCFNENSFKFSNFSASIYSALTHLWEFGNGETSNQFDIYDYQYQYIDTFKVKLKSTTGFGCSDSTEKTVYIIPNPEFSLGNDTSLCAGKHIILNAGFQFDEYLWDNDSLDPVILVDTNNFGLGTQLHWVRVTKNGCDAYDTILVHFYDCTSIEDLHSFSCRLYPNPVGDIIWIKFEKGVNVNELFEFNIYDLNGKLVMSKNIKGQDNQINMEGLSKGSYIFSIKNNKGDFAKGKIIKN